MKIKFTKIKNNIDWIMARSFYGFMVGDPQRLSIFIFGEIYGILDKIFKIMSWIFIDVAIRKILSETGRGLFSFLLLPLEFMIVLLIFSVFMPFFSKAYAIKSRGSPKPFDEFHAEFRLEGADMKVIACVVVICFLASSILFFKSAYDIFKLWLDLLLARAVAR